MKFCFLICLFKYLDGIKWAFRGVTGAISLLGFLDSHMTL